MRYRLNGWRKIKYKENKILDINMATKEELNKADFDLIKMHEEENKEFKRKIIDIDARIAECQNKKLELEKAIESNIEFMKTLSRPWTDEMVERGNQLQEL